MKRQGTGIRDQGLGIRDQGLERLERLLREALPPVDEGDELNRDLWPAMAYRLQAEPMPAIVRVPWFDWALMGGLAALLAMFPAWIPVLLYYL